MNTITKHPIQLIYVVNSRIPNVRAHGIQIVHTCEALARAGIEVTLISTMFSGIKPPLTTHYGIKQLFRHQKLFAVDIPNLPGRYVIRNTTFFVSVLVYVFAKLLMSAVTRRPFVLYARGEAVIPLTLFAAAVPVFFETHQIRNHARLYRIALRAARGIIVITQSLKDMFVRDFNIPSEKIVLARDAVDLERFASARRNTSLWGKHGVPPGARVALYVGTLAEEKGVSTLADSAAYLPADLHTVFVGGTTAQVAAFKKRYGESKNVHILGHIAHTDVPEYVASADILVLPDSGQHTFSNLYTSPMKLFEYMASGRPIVAASVPSLREVLDATSAVFFKPDDPNSLAEAITNLIGDDARMSSVGEKGRKLVAEFTWERRADRIVSHIQSRLDSR